MPASYVYRSGSNYFSDARFAQELFDSAAARRQAGSGVLFDRRAKREQFSVWSSVRLRS